MADEKKFESSLRADLAAAEAKLEQLEKRIERYYAGVTLGRQSANKRLGERVWRLELQRRALVREVAGIKCRLTRSEKFANRKRATTGPDTTRVPRDEARRRKAEVQLHERKRNERAAANLVDFNPETRAGMRDHQVEDLGAQKRARSPTYARLFTRKADATQERLLTCHKFDQLWHSAHAGMLPEPRFLPEVDRSRRGGGLPPRGWSMHALDDLVAAIGEAQVALLYCRIIENFSYRAMIEQGHPDEQRVRTAMVAAQFLAAVDAAAVHFGISQPAPLVRRMRAAIRPDATTTGAVA